MKRETVYIYGRHAVWSAIEHAPQAVSKIYLLRTVSDEKLVEKATALGIPVQPLKHGAVGDVSHQGYVAHIHPEQLVVPLSDLLLKTKIEKGAAFVVTAGLTDPHNVGALVRSATAFGIKGLIMPQSKQVAVTGGMVKSSVGTAFLLPLAMADSTETALAALKERGVYIYGLSGAGTAVAGNTKYKTPCAFVVGNEGTGLSIEVEKMCDELLSISINPDVESLNAAVATSLVLFDFSLQQQA